VVLPIVIGELQQRALSFGPSKAKRACAANWRNALNAKDLLQPSQLLSRDETKVEAAGKGLFVAPNRFHR
jgi:hypothetical protein